MTATSPAEEPTEEYLTWSTTLTTIERHDVPRPSHPMKWSSMKKNSISTLSVLTTFMAAYSISAYVAGVSQIAKEFRSSRVIALIGMTTFQTGFAFGPMVLAPFSELNGRKPVYLATYGLFNACTLIVALINSLPGLLVVRFFQGIGASTFSTMVGGVIADLYPPRERGLPMSLFATASFSGGVGEMVSGFLLQQRSWRWIYWHQLMINCVLMVLIAIFFQESRAPVLLSRKAKLLNTHAVEHSRTDEEREKPVHWKVKEDEQRNSLSTMIRISLTRPFLLLSTEPVVFWFSMWISFSWALLFLFFESVPLTFSASYGFSQTQTGLVLLATVVGAILANCYNPVQEMLFRRYQNRLPRIRLLRRQLNNAQTANVWNPEARLYSACFFSILMSAGLFMYGGTNRSSIFWIVPTIAISIVTFSAYAIYLSVFNYFADIYSLYASSAMAAQSFCRNALAGALPLVVDITFTRLTFVGASSLLGGIGLFMSIVPWMLVLFGPAIRGRSRFAKSMRLA